MKKKILSLVSAIAMAATMLSSFVVAQAEEAPTLKIVTDAADATAIKAGDTFNVSVVLDGVEGLTKYDSKKKNGTGISSLQFVLFMPDNEYITSGSETVCSGAVGNWIEAEGGWNLSVAFSGAAAAMINSVPFTLATVDFTANKDVTEAQVFEILSTEVAAVTKQVVTSGAITSTTKFELSNGTLAAEKLTVGAAPAPAQPTVETINAETVALAAPGENEVAGTDVAAAYKATYNFVSGQTAAWTATGKADYAIDLANISGPTTLGLIVTDAAVSNVALKVTTPAN